MSSSEFFSEFSLMRRNMAALQYHKHPVKTLGVDFNARARNHFLALDGIWRDSADDVADLLSSCGPMSPKKFEDIRVNFLRDEIDKELAWSLNRLRFAAGSDENSATSAVSELADPWFNYRMQEIKRALLLDPRPAGPIKRNARLVSSAAFSGMHVALRALESSSAKEPLGSLSRSALAAPQGS